MKWPDARGWIGLSVFALTVMVLWMVAVFPDLRQDEFFKVLATAIVLTGFIQSVVGWAYTATKQGGEMAERNQAVVEQVAQTTANTAAATIAQPQPVKVVNPPDDPANVIEAPTASQDDAGLPEALR